VNFIDVRDVSEIIYKLMMEEKANGERYILNSVKMPYKELFFSIADEFSKKRPKIKANKVVSELAWRIEGLKSLLTGKQPLITKETAKISTHSSTYNNSKVNGILKHKFIQPKDTIHWVCQELMSSIR
jgi:dihydroflavonol-4-reductase